MALSRTSATRSRPDARGAVGQGQGSGQGSVQRWSADCSDAELIEAIADGDEISLAEVFAREAQRVRAVARAVCGPERAEDVVQEVFFLLWTRPGSYDPARGSLRRFLSVQARSRSIDVIRTDGARWTREHELGRREAQAHLVVDQLDGDVVDRLLGEVAHDALLRLRPEQREAIALAYFGGLSYREVARCVGRPEGTVKGQIRSGLLRLRADIAVLLEVD